MSDPLTSVTPVRRQTMLEVFARAWAARDVERYSH
jgi:hypothetical protein